MYISKFVIKNFRTFDYLSVSFNKGVNIIIGENNTGKTAIIDALRICLGYGKVENSIYIQESDIYINQSDPNESNNEISFDLIFEMDESNPIERQCFYDFISQDPNDLNKQTIQFHLKFILENREKKKYFKRIVWGGDNEGQQIPYEALQEIFFTYLGPLRDAINGLRPYSYDNKTSLLFNQLTKYKKDGNEVPLNEDKKKELAKKLYDIFDDETNDWKHILKAGKEKVNTHLEGTGITHKHPNIEMKYVGRKYSDVVRGIELKSPVYEENILGENEQKYFEIFQNGLGENNLIYASVILGDLINRCEDNDLEIYNALLVEEPEAHLHPQYQNTFFEYLNKLQDKGLQIFITSHSPTITAKSDIKNVTILQKQKKVVKAFSFNSLSEEDFSKTNQEHLRKFLDTTKAQMFFANGTILVEGIAEAILIPLLSSKFKTDPKIDLEKYGIELVNIGGVAFEHFGKLYNNGNENKRLLSKCAIITDSDPVNGTKSDRAQNAQALEKNNLKVSLAPHTFEYDLFSSEVNKKIMREVYREMHPDTSELKTDFDVDTLMCKLKSNKDKAEFALRLYDKLFKTDSFDVPEYITDAVNFVIS